MQEIKKFIGIEESYLAPYAMKSSDSKGRVYKEKEHLYRSIYQRDRDRIIHCEAFRRLEYKTQVFIINHEGDYYRTRLTHTIEVSQIARTIANALCLNVDLVEAIALAHDLGHTPFGHAGEDILNELMKGHGGFNHNSQSLRVVEHLEERYPEFLGLNLSWETREGIAKHSTKFDSKSVSSDLEPYKLPTLEAQVVNVSDEIAYDNHDLDDGLTSGLLSEEDLNGIPIWNKIRSSVTKKYPSIKPEMLKSQVIKFLIDRQVTDLIQESKKKLGKIKPKSARDVKNLEFKIISMSKDMLGEVRPLKEFLAKNFYHHYRVRRMAFKARSFIKQLFEVYLVNPELLSKPYQEKMKKEKPRRIICDYIASMTDRCALDEYKKLFDPHEKV